MANDLYEYLKGQNSKAVELLDRNHHLAAFIAKVVHGFDSYCREHDFNPYTTDISNAIISRDGQIVARIEGR